MICNHGNNLRIKKTRFDFSDMQKHDTPIEIKELRSQYSQIIEHKLKMREFMKKLIRNWINYRVWKHFK